MAVSTDEVRAVARLARLRLTDDEVERFADQLGAILDHVEALGDAPLDGEFAPVDGETEVGGREGPEKPAGSEVLGARAPLRGEGEPPDALDRPVGALAPAWEHGFFTVPRLGALDDDADEDPSGDVDRTEGVARPDAEDAGSARGGGE